MKISTILALQSIGYFQAKSQAKKDTILGEFMASPEYTELLQNFPTLVIFDIIAEETERRHQEYLKRVKRAALKAQTDAEKPLTKGADTTHEHVTRMPPGKYVLTVAQNNTDVDMVMLGALEHYCAENAATLLVARCTYNVNGFQQPIEGEGIYYSPAITNYMVQGQIDLGGLHFCSNANVLPTAKNPLSGFASITPAGIDIVIPSVKISLQCTAALKGGRAKRMFSTGAITKINYMARKAGAVAETEHCIGALFVDTTVSPPIARQLEKMPDSFWFYDEGNLYHASGVAPKQYPAVLQLGDIHAEKMEPENLEKIKQIIEKYAPENLMVHDVMDFSSRNHHNVRDCVFMFDQQVKGNTVRQDVKAVTQVLDALAHTLMAQDWGAKLHVIESNHDLAINTWLKNTDFKLDPVNATVYLQCMLELYKHVERGQGTNFNMLEYVYTNIGEGRMIDAIEFHEVDESLEIAGIEHGCHGHIGANGSKGSPQQFRALGVKMNTGHTHTPSIHGGCYTAGVSGSLEMGYNTGPSSWQLAHVLTWPNGQRQIIFM